MSTWSNKAFNIARAHTDGPNQALQTALLATRIETQDRSP